MDHPLLTGRPLHHIGIAVASIAQAAPLYELVAGQRCSSVEVLPEHGVRVAFCGPLELLEPLGPDTGVGRFLQKHGPGLHHVALATPDIASDLTNLEVEGIRLIDREARAGAHGHRVAFLHPSSTQGTLIELVESTS